MRLLTVVAAAMLTGCMAVPVKRTFPAAPEMIMKPCPPLEQTAPGTAKLSEILNVVTENYTKYHECQINQETWIEWYTTQKKIFDDGQ